MWVWCRVSLLTLGRALYFCLNSFVVRIVVYFLVWICSIVVMLY